MHKLTASIIIAIIAIAIIIVMISSTGDKTDEDNLSVPETLQQQAQQQNQANVIPTTTGATATPAAEYSQAVIQTSKGSITIEFYTEDAPNTVANFGKKALEGFYEELTFHRVEDWVVQGGDPRGDGTGGGQMATELNNWPFIVGSVGVARGGNIQISNDAQFFITKQEADWLNAQYTNFGIVTEGMDVVEQLEIGDEIVSISVE